MYCKYDFSKVDETIYTPQKTACFKLKKPMKQINKKYQIKMRTGIKKRAKDSLFYTQILF